MKKILILIGVLLNTILISKAQDIELPRRSFMGIRVQAINADKEKQYALANNQGVWIEKVFDKSSAKNAGLQKDDVILELNGQKIIDVPQFIKLIKTFRAGNKVSATIWRNQKREKLKILMKELPKEENPNWHTYYEAIQYDGNISRVIITKPKTNQTKFPAVYLIQGINCGSIDYPFGRGALMPFVDSLSNRGLVTIRVEKTGIGDSKGQDCMEANFNTELATFREGLRYLKQLDYVDAENVYMFGWSMGGFIAPVLASENPVKGIAVFGTGVKSWLEYEMENTRRQLQLTLGDYVEIDKRMRSKELALHYLLVEKLSPEEIITKNKDLEGYVSFYPRHHTYIQQLADLNMAVYWSKVDAKVLSIHGTGDFVSAAKAHESIATIVNQNGKNEAIYLEMPDIDHFMAKAGTEEKSIQMNTRERNYKLVQVICDWIEDKNIDHFR